MKNSWKNLAAVMKQAMIVCLLVCAFINFLPAKSNAATVTYSCLPTDNNILLWTENAITSLGSYPLVQANIDIYNIENARLETDPVTGRQTPGCSVPMSAINRGIHFCYDATYFLRYFVDNSATRDCTGSNLRFLDLGEEKTIGTFQFQLVRQADKGCIQVKLLGSWYTIGCKYMQDTTSAGNTNACGLSQSCYDRASQQSMSFFPVTSVIVQCFSETLQKIFTDPTAFSGAACDSSTGSITLFSDFKNSMKNTVMVALTLFVIFQAMKVMLGMEAPRKGEIFVFILKFALVLYFAVGEGANMLFGAFMAIAHDFAQMIYASGGSMGLCQYDRADYATGYSYLALWDGLDCRIAYYLGINPMDFALGGKSSVRLFSFIFPALLNFQLLFAIVCIVFAIFVISITMFLVHTYIIALIVIAILLFLAPLFVPLVLFKQTKAYFDGWVKLIIGYSLQPAILFSFMALMLTIFDMTFYGNCVFTKINGVNFPISPISSVISNMQTSTKSLPFFVVATPGSGMTAAQSELAAKVGNIISKNTLNSSSGTAPSGASGTSADPNCYKSFGYMMNPVNADNWNRGGTYDQFKSRFFTTINGIFFSFVLFTDLSEVKDLILNMLLILFFCYLFYHFSKQLSAFATDLTGASDLGGMAISPTKAVDTAKDLAMKVIDAKTGGAASKAQAAMKEDKGGGGAARGGASKGIQAPVANKGGGGAGAITGAMKK